MKPLLILKTYAWLIKTLREYGPITFKELNAMWNDDRLSEGNSMVRQTYARYKRDMEEFFNITIRCDSQNRYYIENERSLNQDSVPNWMMSSMTVNTTLANYKEVHSRIIMEDIPSSGIYLNDIVAAMGKRVKIDLTYQRYIYTWSRQHRVAPYYLKLYNRRWYLLGMKDDGTMLTFALDRITALVITDEEFEMDKNCSASDYFMDCYGVMKDMTKPAERIVLRAYGTEANCMRDLKLHPSQKEIATGDDYSDFELYLRPSMDFRGKILERGSRLKVMEPQHLAEEIREIHTESVNLYEKDEDCSEV